MFQVEQSLGDPYAMDLRFTSQQERLTALLLRPNIDKILQRLAELRAQVDAEFAPKVQDARRRGVSKEYGEISLAHYPFGFCREIRDAVLARMLVDPFFQEWVSKGLVLRSVFIFLRGSYFQNAIQFGNLYFDAANDTAHIEKPKLDWAPITELDYENVESWSRFAEVATRYLKVELYPNLFFPLAFPAIPFFAVLGSGRLELLLAQHLILNKDLQDGMRRTQALLDDPKWMSRRLPEPYVQLLERSCGGNIYEAFPLEYDPCDVKHLRDAVLPEFINLSKQNPASLMSTLKSYFDLVTRAAKTLRERRLCPSPESLARLRAEGHAPQPAQMPGPFSG